MSISELTPGASPAQTLAEALTVVREVARTLWSARTDDELLDTVGLVAQLTSALAAVEAGAVAEVDTRDLATQTLRFGSTGDWLTHTAGLRRGEGKHRVVRAKALTGPLTRTFQALVAGSVSPGQVDTVHAAVTALPSGDLVRRRGEKVMLTHATRLTGSELARAGRHLVEVVDPDAVDRRLEAALERQERAAHLDRYLALTTDRAGGVWIKGHGTAEDGVLLTAALLPLTRPEPATTADTGDDTGDPCQPVRDPRAYGARTWDALILLARHGLDTNLVPDTHGTPPRLLITLDHHTLTRDLTTAGIGVGTTADGTELPPGVLRRLACDAEIIPAVLGTRSEILDVGRTHRTATPALWTALVIRDQHCTFPACHRPPAMCQAHHLIHWLDHGPTALDNLALLCGHHHRTLHHTPWEIRLNPHDRRPEFKPPPKPGVHPEWTRDRPRLE